MSGCRAGKGDGGEGLSGDGELGDGELGKGAAGNGDVGNGEPVNGEDDVIAAALQGARLGAAFVIPSFARARPNVSPWP